MKSRFVSFRIISSVALVCTFFVQAIQIIYADTTNVTISVNNVPPSFTAVPAESPASDSTTPTNVGSNVTFQATGTDGNAGNYYLIICKTDAVTANNSAAPTCTGGSWCVSSATASGSQASCSYSVVSGDAESQAWYAFVCDGNATSAACSSSSQGSGSSGSPFKVNRVPSFTGYSVGTPRSPGQNVTWSTTASDSDTDGSQDQVKLIVCKTTGISGDDCDGGESDRWCSSALATSNPSCSYSIPIPTPDAGSIDAYVYIVDSHNFGATSANQADNVQYAVSNAGPSVSNLSINGGSNITLNESTTTPVVVTATISDNNSCEDISTATASLYRSGIGFGACDNIAENNDNNCYANLSCTVVSSGNTCTGPTDISADYSCTFDLQYFADPTDTGTLYSANLWQTYFRTTDNNSLGSSTSGGNVEVLSLIAFDVTSSISYGGLTPGQSNDPLNQIITYTGTGNVGLDFELSGTNMTSGGDSITVDKQKYALASSTAYASGTALSTVATEVEVNLQKTTSIVSPATKDVWFGIEIPLATPIGTYTGTITTTGIKGETANW